MKEALEPYLSGISFSAQGKYEEALLSFEHSLSLDPENTGAWVGKGLALAYLGQYNACIQAFDRAIARDENDEITWYNRGLALHILGHDEEALLSFDRILAETRNTHLHGEAKPGRMLPWNSMIKRSMHMTVHSVSVPVMRVSGRARPTCCSSLTATMTLSSATKRTLPGILPVSMP